MGDVVLVMQSLANPNKFGTSGSDAKHITVQGAENADVDTTSKGLTSNDALEIQKYLLGLSKWDK
jgi:mannan endo-1,4-beta-mannosidase